MEESLFIEKIAKKYRSTIKDTLRSIIPLINIKFGILVN